MSRRKRMWIDVDEVLADFLNPGLAIVERLHGRKMTADDLTEWSLFAHFEGEELDSIVRECGRPGFCASLPEIPGAREAVRELRKHVDLYAVTAPFDSATWVYERDWWLRTHMGFRRDEIAHLPAKHLITADACLDDSPENVLNWSASHPNGLAMLWPIPSTRHLPLDNYRVKDWDDVIRRIVDL